MDGDRIAHASIVINGPAERVWWALVDPAAIKQYLFGTQVESDWREGSPIVWRGEWQGRAYEDKGTILQLQPGRRLKYSHFSPLAGLADEPANYHTVTVELTADGSGTRVALSQDNNGSEDERAHSEKNWNTVLAGLKEFVER